MAHFFALTFISNIITNYCVYSLIDYKRFLYVRESAGSLTVYFPQWKKKASAKGPPKEALDGSTWAMKAVLPKRGQPETSESLPAPPFSHCNALAVPQFCVGRTAFPQEADQG